MNTCCVVTKADIKFSVLSGRTQHTVCSFQFIFTSAQVQAKESATKRAPGLSSGCWNGFCSHQKMVGRLRLVTSVPQFLARMCSEYWETAEGGQVGESLGELSQECTNTGQQVSIPQSEFFSRATRHSIVSVRSHALSSICLHFIYVTIYKTPVCYICH